MTPLRCVALVAALALLGWPLGAVLSRLVRWARPWDVDAPSRWGQLTEEQMAKVRRQYERRAA